MNERTIKQNASQIYLTPGLSYRVWNKLHLELIIPNIVDINYQVSRDATGPNKNKSNTFSFNSSLNSNGGGLSYLGLGFHFIF